MWISSFLAVPQKRDVQCFVSPCDVEQCNVKGAVCEEDYSNGCDAIWRVNGEDVTAECGMILLFMVLNLFKPGRYI